MTNEIAKIEKLIYTARAHTTGGRDGGTSLTDDGRLEIHFSSPGEGTGTNPEQLFAAGWSACFLSAMKLIARKERIPLPEKVAIDAEVDLGQTTDGHYGMAARLTVSLPGVAPDVAQDLIERTHDLCPYSRATHGNVNVVITVIDTAVATTTA